MKETIEKLITECNDPFKLMQFFAEFKDAVGKKLENEIAIRREQSDKATKEAAEMTEFIKAKMA